MSYRSLLPCFTCFPFVTWACALLLNAVKTSKGHMTKFWALIFKQGQGPGVLGCQTLLLCSHFTPADTQRHILSGQVSAQLHGDML